VYACVIISMMKRFTPKLTVRRETLRVLARMELVRVAAGDGVVTGSAGTTCPNAQGDSAGAGTGCPLPPKP
jgi:hypothetical protein